MHRGDELGRGLVSIDDRAIEQEKQGLDIDTMLLAYLADALVSKAQGDAEARDDEKCAGAA